MMTLDEAIEHAEWCVDNSCGECAEEHRQLAEWLRELRDKRAEERSCAAIAAEAARQNRDLYAERAKLRDLVREMSFPYKYGDFDCGLCPHTDRCWDSETLDFNPDGCVILKMVRDLGIEVE